jgi:hypothetical protein
VEAEKQTRAVPEDEKAGLTTGIRELQAEIDRDEELEATSPRVSDVRRYGGTISTTTRRPPSPK